MNETQTTTRPTTAAPSAPAQPVLRVVGGNKIYGGVHAIEAINFDLYAGEIHAMVGENGAGKSTLCKALAGAIKLTSGEYYVDGKPILSSAARCARCRRLYGLSGDQPGADDDRGAEHRTR